MTFRKSSDPARLQIVDDLQFTNIVSSFITKTIQNGTTDTNGIMMAVMEWILRNMIIIGNVDVFTILNKNFQLGDNGQWSIE